MLKPTGSSLHPQIHTRTRHAPPLPQDGLEGALPAPSPRPPSPTPQGGGWGRGGGTRRPANLRLRLRISAPVPGFFEGGECTAGGGGKCYGLGSRVYGQGWI